MRRLLHLVVSEGARRRLRHLGRLRWITKTRVLRRSGVRVRDHLPYVLTDPEVDSFTYAIDNEDELAAVLADVLQVPAAQTSATIRAAHVDPLLARALTQGWPEVLWTRRHPRPGLPQLASWAILRLERPALAVEAGVLDGMTSTVMLAALERNAREGDEGTLISVDVMPGAGTMVPAWLCHRWELVTGDSATAIGPAVGNRQVGYFVADSLQDNDHVDLELAAVLERRAPVLTAMTVWGTVDSLRRSGARTVQIQERPRAHFYAGRRPTIARFGPP